MGKPEGSRRAAMGSHGQPCHCMGVKMCPGGRRKLTTQAG